MLRPPYTIVNLPEPLTDWNSMDNVEFLTHCVAFQERMLADAVEAHARVQTKYARLDALRAMADQQSAAALDDIEKAKQELEDAKAALAAAQGPTDHEGEG